MNKEFKIGDRVIIHKPKNKCTGPIWVSAMNKYDKIEITLNQTPNNAGTIYKFGYWFSINWLKKVKDSKNIDDISIFF